MKKIMYLLSIGLMVILLGCGAPTSTTPAKEATQPAKVITAAGISDSFKNCGLPMTDIVDYTEETDTNKLMGRPNQYILSLIHISEPTRLGMISYAVFCLKKKKKKKN